MANPTEPNSPIANTAARELSDQEIHAQEHSRRRRHALTNQEDDLLNRLSDSPGYVSTSTPAGRIAMQRMLNELHGAGAEDSIVGSSNTEP